MTEPETTTEDTTEEVQTDAVETEATEEARPEGLPEGFDTLADYVAKVNADAEAHAALRKKMSQEGAPKTEPKPKAEVKQKEPEAPEEPVEAEEHGDLSITEEQRDRMSSEIRENGALAPDSVAELVALGLKEEYIQAQAGLAAVAHLREAAIYSACGDNAQSGEERFQVAAQWAQNNLEPSEIDATQALLESQDVNIAKKAAADLVARCQSHTPPNLVHGQTHYNGDDRVVASHADVGEAVMDPRYLRDPIYTKKVQDDMRKLV